MKEILLVAVVSIAPLGCTEQDQSAGKPVPEKQPAADIAAGKAIAERNCIGCHRVDGSNTAPAIPVLAAQRERYLVSALHAYQAGTRIHAALKDLTGHMSEADLRNMAAYYASLPPVVSAWSKDVKLISPYDRGKELASPCEKCHGEAGNSTTSGVPSLAGQQPRYLVLAVQEYLHFEHEKAPMHALLPRLARAGPQ